MTARTPAWMTFLLGLLCYHVHEVSGIWCFQCNSHMDPDCANIQPNDTSSPHYKECRVDGPQMQNFKEKPPHDAVEFFCRKIVQRINDRNGLIRVVRKCGWVLHSKLDCYSYTSLGHVDIVCQCFSDACNSAKPSASISEGLTLPILITIFYSIF